MISRIIFSFLVSVLFGFFIQAHILLGFGILLLGCILFFSFAYPEKTLITALALFPFNNLVTFRAFAFDVIDCRLIELIFIISCLALLLRKISAKSSFNYLDFGKIDFWLILFIIVSFSGVFYSRYPSVVVKEVIQLLYLYLFFKVATVLFSRKAYFETFFKILPWSMAVFCFFGFIGIILGRFPIPSFFVVNGILVPVTTALSTQLTEKSGLSLLRADSFFWGAVGTANILIILYYLMRAKFTLKNRSYFQIAIIVFLVLTGSRAAFFVFYLLFLIEAIIEQRAVALKLLIGVVVAGILLVTPSIGERVLESFSKDEASSRSHFAVWMSSLEMFKKNPLFGVGTGCFAKAIPKYEYFSTFKVFYSSDREVAPHNLIMQILAENGIFGAVIFLFFLLSFIHLAKQLMFSKDITNRSISFAFLGTLLMNLTMNAFLIEPFWLILALVYSRQRSLLCANNAGNLNEHISN